MKLNVNPNRMELLRLRRRLLLAQRGHKLLQDKLEQMMHTFLGLIREITALSQEVNRRIKQVFLDFALSRCLMPQEDFSDAINAVRFELGFRAGLEKIMNVPIPQFDFKEPEIRPDYNFLKVTPQLDIALAELKKLLPMMIRLGSLMKSCQLLSFEIERTRRRVNALEYLLIPCLEQTIRFIRDKLNELERDNLVRLIRVKEILRQAE